MTDEERSHAKVLNFGMPGGMGPKVLCASANKDFGMDWNEDDAIQMRNQWLDLFPEVMAFLDKGDTEPEGVWTATGRYRMTSKYTELRNTVFQGLGADGMNLALKRLWLHGYRIAAVIHDEVLIEVPVCDDYTAVVEDIERLIIDGLKQVAPDMEVRVESVVSTYWSKKAKKVHDDEGRLVAWPLPKNPIRKVVSPKPIQEQHDSDDAQSEQPQQAPPRRRIRRIVE